MTHVGDESRPRAPYPSELLEHTRMVALGAEKGENYQRVWDSTDRVCEVLIPQLQPFANESASKVKPPFSSEPVISAVIFLFGLGVLIWFLNLFTAENAAPAFASFLFFLWLATSWLWFKSLFWIVQRNDAIKYEAAARGAWLTEVGVVAALDALYQRQVAARSHNPIVDSSLPFSPKSAMPSPQEFGVGHQGAEALCAGWMRFYGEVDAEATRVSGDGGIDISSLHYIAQVKNYAGTVGVAEVREMAGVALDDGRKALFFTSGRYALGATTFADRVGIPLFIYDAMAGTLAGANEHAERIFRSGL